MDPHPLTGTNTLLLYDERQTFTSTVFEHVSSLARFSSSRVFFAHQTLQAPVSDLGLFDVVIIHYSIRLPFNQIAEETAHALTAYTGLKALFIQDEYDDTQRTRQWIKRLGIELVFSSVPAESMARVYPPGEFPGVRFVSNLTGYVPEALAAVTATVAPSGRPLRIGYRGRPLPVRYGALGRDKVDVGRIVKAYCQSAGIEHDISWEEEDRIYGDAWYDFIRSCRAVLGSESGSNVFDDDGTLERRIAEYQRQHPRATDRDVYDGLIAPLEQPGLMNQVSPRVFEAIACRTALVLFEGNYSGVVKPGRHFIPLRRDGANLAEIVEQLRDGAAVDAMVERAYADVLGSGRYSYQAFVRMVDDEIAGAIARRGGSRHRPATAVTRPLVSRTWPEQRARPRTVPESFPEALFMRAVRLLLPLFPRGLKDLVKRFASRLLIPPE